MDINTLLDFVEELLNMYGYETRRNVGIVGGKITTAPLEKETGKINELETIPKKTEQGIVYKADILAEKKDIERPFGRVVVRYKRGTSTVSVADCEQASQIREHADAHSVLLLTLTGATPDAETAAVPLNVTILTPDKVQGLLGKAMTKEKWWFNAPAYPITFDYEKVKWKLKWFFEKILFVNLNCIWFWNKELSYEPYWKFSYHVSKNGEMKEGMFSLNAFTGGIDVWFDINPDLAEAVTEHDKRAWFYAGVINVIEECYMVPRGKIQKPKLPKGVNYVVHRPAMEKHEAKLAAIQWVSYVEGVDPEDVVITGRELIYHPWWKFFYFYRPVVKNAWEDTEYTGFKMSGVYGDIFNQWKLYGLYKRDIIYYYMEKSLIKLFGRDRYVRFMRSVTLGISVLWWNYNLELKPIYVWILLLMITMGTIYAFVSATWGLSLILGILLVFIFMGPGYAFLYVTQDYLKRYPSRTYPHPSLTKKKYQKKIKPVEDAKKAVAQLEKMAEAGKLTRSEKRELGKLREKKVDSLVKTAKGKKRFWQR
jgi:hypothetical protein